ncbi:MAG: CotH kinase family protein [Flavobacteriales bacterium]|nr:CotH kinase family protein [Flavobacteriales bacterium]MCB9363632.1 CotH kinase family protein [Flavobacteriales bacterium]
MKIYFKLIVLFLSLSISKSLLSQNGNSLFDDSYIHTIEINSIAPYTYEQFHDTLFNSHLQVFWLSNSSLKNYYKASVVIDGVTTDTIGVRYKGNSTFQNADAIGKYAIKLDFNEYVNGQNYDGLKKLNLNNNLVDPSCLRAKLSFEVMQRMGIVSPRTAFAKVYINGNYRGIYTMVEQIDKTFVKSHFDPDSTGYLHKAYNFTVGLPSNGGYQSTIDSDLAEYMPLKTKKSTNNYQPIKDFISAANNATDIAFENNINGVFDLSSFIKLQAINMVLSDKDHYCTAGWNFYMYQNPTDNKWYMLPWDYDLGFDANSTYFVSNPSDHSSLYIDNCYLTKRMMNIPNLKTQYREALCEVMNTGMDSIWINDRILTLKNLIATEVENDPHFWSISDYNYYLNNTYTINAPGNNLNGYAIIGLREYINNRFNQVITDLASNNYDCDLTLNVVNTSLSSTENFIAYPNPTSDFVSINGSELNVGDIKVYTLLGQSINNNNIKKVNANTIQIDFSNLDKGVYIIKTNTTATKVYKQ